MYCQQSQHESSAHHHPYHDPSQNTCSNPNPHPPPRPSALQRRTTPRISRSTRPGRRHASNLEHASDITNLKTSPPTPFHMPTQSKLSKGGAAHVGIRVELTANPAPGHVYSKRSSVDMYASVVFFVGLDCLLPKAYSSQPPALQTLAVYLLFSVPSSGA